MAEAVPAPSRAVVSVAGLGTAAVESALVPPSLRRGRLVPTVSSARQAVR